MVYGVYTVAGMVVGCTRVVGYGGSVDPWWCPVVRVRVPPLHCIPTVTPLGSTVTPLEYHCFGHIFEKYHCFGWISPLFGKITTVLAEFPTFWQNNYCTGYWGPPTPLHRLLRTTDTTVPGFGCPGTTVPGLWLYRTTVLGLWFYCIPGGFTASLEVFTASLEVLLHPWWFSRIQWFFSDSVFFRIQWFPGFCKIDCFAENQP